MGYKTIAKLDAARADVRLYTAFGRVVSSDLSLTNLTEVDDGPPCLTVRQLMTEPERSDYQPVYERLNSAGESSYRLRYGRGGYVWTYSEVAFTIQRDGKSVGWFAEQTRVSDAAALLSGPILGFALRLQGQVGLHSSVVVSKGRALGLLAPSGHGKSTFAAALMARGCSLLSDDVAMLEIRPDGPWILPSYPKIKLWPEAIEGLDDGVRWQDLQQYVSWLDKRILPATAVGAICEAPRPLSALFALYPLREGDVSVERLTGHQAALALMGHSYCAHLLTMEPNVLADQMAVLGQVAESVPIYAIQYPHGFDRLPEVANAVLRMVGDSP